MPRNLESKDVDELLALRRDDITTKLLKKLFIGTVKSPKPRFDVEDYFRIPQGSCSNNKMGMTTVGVYIVNRLLTDGVFDHVTGYINDPLTSKNVSKFYKKISNAFSDDVITDVEMKFAIDMLEWIGGGELSDLLNVSLSGQMFILPQEVKDLRDRLFKENEEALTSGDITISSRVENEIVAKAKEYMMTRPEWEHFASGAKLDFDNSFKTMMLVKGPVLNNGTGEWQFLKSNYNDGISKEEYPIFADSSVAGVHSRAKGVAIGGYTVKKYIATLQDVVTGEDGSDCKTKETLATYLDPFFANTFIGMNIDENGKIVNLTSENIGKYTGRMVNLFSPMFCKHEGPKICSKCTGTHPKKINLKKIGLASTKTGSTMMQKSLKAFHSKKVYLYETTVRDLFGSVD